MNLTIEEKLVMAQMLIDGFERSTIMFFQRVLPAMRNGSEFTCKDLVANGAFMTCQGCNKHLRKLAGKGYIRRVECGDRAVSTWMLVKPILKDKQLAVMAQVFLIEDKYQVRHRAAS